MPRSRRVLNICFRRNPAFSRRATTSSALAELVGIAAEPVQHVGVPFHAALAAVGMDLGERILQPSHVTPEPRGDKQADGGAAKHQAAVGEVPLFPAPETAHRRLSIKRDGKRPALIYQLGDSINRRPHVSGVMQDAPAIDDVEPIPVLGRKLEDVCLAKLVVMPRPPAPNEGARGGEGVFVEVNGSHRVGAEPQRRQCVNARAAADVEKAHAGQVIAA